MFGRKDHKKTDNHHVGGFIPDSPEQALFRGCVGAYLKGAITAEREMWIRMFIQAGKPEPEAIRIVDEECKQGAEWFSDFNA